MWNQDQKLVHLPSVCIYLPSETYLEVMCSYEQVMLHQHCVMLWHMVSLWLESCMLISWMTFFSNMWFYDWKSYILIGWVAFFSRRWQHFLQHVVLLCLEILHSDWLVNWVLAGALGVSPKRFIYKNIQDRLNKLHSAKSSRTTKN